MAMLDYTAIPNPNPNLKKCLQPMELTANPKSKPILIDYAFSAVY